MIVNGKICKCQGLVFRLDSLVAVEPMRTDTFRIHLVSGDVFALDGKENREKIITVWEDYWRRP
jgi:hypothetical protein